MKGIVIYKGKYGSTKQYAEWIAEETAMEALAPEALRRSTMNECKFIVICSAVYMGKLLLKDWLKKNYRIFRDKKLFLVVVCAIAASEEGKQKKILHDNIPGALLGGIDVSFLPGRLTLERLSWKDRIILKMAAWIGTGPKERAAIKSGIDGVRKENIFDVVCKIESFAKGAPVAITTTRE